MKNKKLLLSLVAVVIILAVVIVLLFMRRSPSYEDYDNFGKLPGEISISEKDSASEGFYHAGSDDEQKANNEVVSEESRKFEEFLIKMDASEISYEGSDYPEDSSPYSSSVQFLFFGTSGDIVALTGCINEIANFYAVDASTIEVDGDSNSDENGLYYDVYTVSDRWRIRFMSRDGISYGYVE